MHGSGNQHGLEVSDRLVFGSAGLFGMCNRPMTMAEDEQEAV